MATQIPNTQSGNEYWMRCPECGDSKNPNKAHLSINLGTGAFCCLRCGWAGYLTLSQVLKMVENLDFLTISPEPKDWLSEPEIPEIELGPGSTRPSLLDRYHYWDARDGFPWDVFKYRDRGGRPTGWLLKRKGLGLSYGERTYLYPNPLGGSQMHLRVVEGPYDVIYPEDVAAGGLINPWKAYKDLAPYRLVLCPDGDVWENPELLEPFLRGAKKVLMAGALVGIEYIPGGKDPDECPENEREFFGPSQIKKILRTVLRR